MSNITRNQEIGALYNNGVSVPELAAQFALTTGTIKNIVQGIGADRKGVTSTRHNAILEASQRGLNSKEVAELLNVSVSQVNNVKKDNRAN
jgi:DNA-binding NarL/FixJ family response regulator